MQGPARVERVASVRTRLYGFKEGAYTPWRVTLRGSWGSEAINGKAHKLGGMKRRHLEPSDIMGLKLCFDSRRTCVPSAASYR
jgi:hypothetical protein